MKKVFIFILLSLFCPITVNAVSGCCSSHRGVDCTLIQENGKVVCNDGWRGSSCTYSGMKKCIGYNPKIVTDENNKNTIMIKKDKQNFDKNDSIKEKEVCDSLNDVTDIVVNNSDSNELNIEKDDSIEVIKDEEEIVVEDPIDEVEDIVDDESKEIIEDDNTNKNMNAASIVGVINDDTDDNVKSFLAGSVILSTCGLIYFNRKKTKKI